MTTTVDICNMALSQLGDLATVTSIDPPEGSAQADHCNRFYPIALAEVLAEAPWGFAIKRQTLAKLANKPIGEPDYMNSFVYPSDCVRLINVDRIEQYEPFPVALTYTVEQQDAQKVIICQADSIWVRYITNNIAASAFPSWFIAALVHKLATLLAGPMIPGSSGVSLAEAQMKLYEFYLDKAIQRNAREQISKERYISPFHGDAQEERFNGYY